MELMICSLLDVNKDGKLSAEEKASAAALIDNIRKHYVLGLDVRVWRLRWRWMCGPHLCALLFTKGGGGKGVTSGARKKGSVPDGKGEVKKAEGWRAPHSGTLRQADPSCAQ